MIKKLLKRNGLDLYLFNKGLSYKSHLFMGAHLRTYDGISGVEFLVWAPNAASVRLVGDFNDWDENANHMEPVETTGMWHIFMADMDQGELYKYAIEGQDHVVRLKSDPFAFFSEVKPQTASIVYDLKGFQWTDSYWMKKRKKTNIFKAPLNIYELHLGSWMHQDGQRMDYQGFIDTLIPYVKDMAYTHIEIMPLTEHPYDGSWGYQATGYFSMTSRYGSPKDLMAFINACHKNDIGVILDWVPCHFCNDAHGLRLFDGGPTFEHKELKYADNPLWGTTNFDFQKTQVQSFLISNAMFFLDKFHIDGIRVDAVAFMLYQGYTTQESHVNPHAVTFLQKLNKEVFNKHADILMMAEESSAWPLVTAPIHDGGLGFNFKWNMGWMNDMLKYIESPFEERKNKHDAITFSIMYAFTENFILPLSHDEVVHGKKSLLDKMPGDYWQKFAGLRMFYGYMYAYPGKKLLFMGGEIGQFIEWNFEREIDWFLKEYPVHDQIHDCVKTLNQIYLDQPSMYLNDDQYKGFEWIDDSNHEQSIVSFVRNGNDNEHILVVCNFTPSVYRTFRLGVPRKGQYEVIFNSDDSQFGGSGYMEKWTYETEKIHKHGRVYSIEMEVPPLGTVYLKYNEEKNDEKI